MRNSKSNLRRKTNLHPIVIMLPTPINLKEDNLVELILLLEYRIVSTLPFQFNFSLKKPNEKLRLLLDLRKMNNLVSDDYINNNHPYSTPTDAAQHMARKELFCKLDCLQACQCLQMADQRSKIVSIQFRIQNICILRLAQGLSRAL